MGQLTPTSIAILTLILPPYQSDNRTRPFPRLPLHHVTPHQRGRRRIGRWSILRSPLAWECSENTLSAAFSLVGGQDLVLITSGGITPGTELTSQTLSLNEVSGILPLYSLHFALMDEKGGILATLTEQFDWLENHTITLDHFGANGDSSITWNEGYRLIVGIVKNDVFGAGYRTNFSGLTLSAVQIIPEPTSAMLSLLALAGLAAHRRGK